MMAIFLSPSTFLSNTNYFTENVMYCLFFYFSCIKVSKAKGAEKEVQLFCLKVLCFHFACLTVISHLKTLSFKKCVWKTKAREKSNWCENFFTFLFKFLALRPSSGWVEEIGWICWVFFVMVPVMFCVFHCHTRFHVSITHRPFCFTSSFQKHVLSTLQGKSSLSSWVLLWFKVWFGPN